MAYKGLLELQGVWPSAPPAAADGGWRGVLQLCGVWVVGGTGETPSEFAFHAGFPERTPSRAPARREDPRRRDDDILLAAAAMLLAARRRR